jgi:hypothetical protein
VEQHSSEARNRFHDPNAEFGETEGRVEEVAKLKTWTFTDKDTGNKIGILDDSLAKVAEDRQR